jgi:hypothetical protein
VYLSNASDADGQCATIPDALLLNVGNDVDGDIIVGNWDPTRAQSPTDLRFRPSPGNPLQTGDVINAVKILARRTFASPVTNVSTGNNPVRVFWGQIFRFISGDWSFLNAVASAIAGPGGGNLTPITVNEYWMGDSPLGGCPSSTACGCPSNSTPFSSGPNFDRTPYAEAHVYPDSFLRPPCTVLGATNCTTPSNGNVGVLPTLSCDPSGPGGPIAVTVLPNGPLTSPCAGNDCRGRPSSTSGRVFAVVGGSARGNSAAFDIYGPLDLDNRNNISTVAGSWYNVIGNQFIAEPMPAPTQKKVYENYTTEGKYPNALPTSVVEVFQPGYTTVTAYTSSQPYATTAYFPGLGFGQEVAGFLYDGGNYLSGKYAPGQKIIVAVYDGIVGDTGVNARTTIVGFARITIFGYGNNLNVTGNTPSDISMSGPIHTMYGYVANVDDALKQNLTDVPGFNNAPKLVK